MHVNPVDVEEIKKIIVHIKALKEKLKFLDPRAEEYLSESVSSRCHNFFEERPIRDVCNANRKFVKDSKILSKNKGQGDTVNFESCANQDNLSNDRLNIFLATLLELKDLAEELHKKFSRAFEIKNGVKYTPGTNEDAFGKAIDSLLQQLNNTYKLLEECSDDNKKIINTVEKINQNVSDLSNTMSSVSSDKNYIQSLCNDGTKKSKQSHHRLRKSGLKSKIFDGNKTLQKIKEDSIAENNQMPDSTKLPRPPPCWFSFKSEKSRDLDSLTIIYEAVIPKCNICKKKKCDCLKNDCVIPDLSISSMSISMKSDKKCKRCTKNKNMCKKCAESKGTSEILIPKKVIKANSVINTCDDNKSLKNSPPTSICDVSTIKSEKPKIKTGKFNEIPMDSPKELKKLPKNKYSCFGLFKK